MSESFFERPILNSPYEYPRRHWELDVTGQPTNRIVEQRRSAKYVTPIPKAKKQKKGQKELVAQDLKNGKDNLFVIFGEPDIDIIHLDDKAGEGQIQVKINGVNVFHPSTGEVRSGGPDNIACWFIDTDYDSESFFVRHAYFLGQNDPYSALKTTPKAEINQEAWSTLNSDTSRPFPKPPNGRIAVKVINHLADEVMQGVLDVTARLGSSVNGDWDCVPG